MGNGVNSSVLTASDIALGSVTASNMKSLLSGARWDITQARTITYSFPSGSAYHASNYSSRDEWSTWSAFDEQMKGAARAALSAWSDVANINFVEVADTQNGAGDIRFAWTTKIDASHSAWAYYPYSGASGGDVWMKSSYQGQSAATGSFLFYTLLHEIGHTLGLKHSFESNDDNSAVIDTQYDSTNYTVMSYDIADDYPSTPMYYDIQAIQYLYGANNSAKTGDTTYTLSNASFTIWDSGGTDTLSFANVASNAAIDLRANSTSRNNAGTYVLIMPNVTVENAIGSPNADNIWGNDAANAIDGNGGNDVIYGGAGNDFVRALDDNDVVYGGDGADDLNGNQGQDVVYGDAGNDSVRGGQGNDVVYGNDGDDAHVNGNIGADTVYGGAGADQVFGGQNEDWLYGEAGNDTLSGDLGNDTLTGGTGADRFLFRPSTGADQVQDFSVAEGDRIALPTGTAYSFTLVGGAVAVSLGGTDTLRLVGITSGASADWIVFV